MDTPLNRIKRTFEDDSKTTHFRSRSRMNSQSLPSRSISAMNTLSHQNSIEIHNSIEKRKKQSKEKVRSRTIDPILNAKAYRSLKILKDSKCNQRIATIKSGCYTLLNEASRDNKLKLCETLKKLHPFFTKINGQIVESLLLLGKMTMYYRGQVIKQSQEIVQPCRTANDLGFLLYGKLQLLNSSQFYSSFVHNFETLFEHRFIRTTEKYQYQAKVIEESAVLWVSRQNYYLIRRECFLSMDLKYMFHEFENHLKYYLIRKKLIKIE